MKWLCSIARHQRRRSGLPSLACNCFNNTGVNMVVWLPSNNVTHSLIRQRQPNSVACRARGNQAFTNKNVQFTHIHSHRQHLHSPRNVFTITSDENERFHFTTEISQFFGITSFLHDFLDDFNV